ncbi:hypothetical protein ACHWQZ_G008261 [Mnemiopsis leidyi]
MMDEEEVLAETPDSPFSLSPIKLPRTSPNRRKTASPIKLRSPDVSDSWMNFPTKAKSSLSELALGLLLKSDPGHLLDVLESNLLHILAVDPELADDLDPLPLFPSNVSLKDLNDFYGMMECEIFSNYVNLFLNLPIFGRRMTYLTDCRHFSLDPPLKRRKFRIDHCMVTSWIVVNRLPYFLKSSMYLDYRFSYEILNELSFDGKSLHLVLELKGPVGVNRFRIFLNSRGCANLVSFWMDCERFLLTTDDDDRREAFNAIEILYLKHGSKFELPESIRRDILEKIEKDIPSSLVEVLIHGVPLLERIKKKEVDKIKNFEIVGYLLKSVQDEVMTVLRNYWIPRYFTRNGSPYTDSKVTSKTNIKSHLIWGIEHKAPAPEPVKLMGFAGQAPEDFESIGERIVTQQTLIAQGHAPNADVSSIWNIDLSKRNGNSRRKEKKALKKFTLFEQARKKSMMVPRSNMDSASLLGDSSRGNSRLRSLGINQQQFGSGYPLLEPLGVDFNKDCPEKMTPSPLPSVDVLRRVSRSRTSVGSGKLSTSGIFAKQNSPLAETKPELKLPLITKEAAASPTPDNKDHSDEEDIDIQLPKLLLGSTDGNEQMPLLPTLTKTASPHKQPANSNSTPSRSTAISMSPDAPIFEDEETWDPYLLLEIVNPELLSRPTNDQLNTRKWILGALAASCLAGNPLKDFLSSFSYTHKKKVKKVKLVINEEGGDEEKEEEEEEEEEDSLTDQAEVALNNLDCWQRIERIRSTSGTSHAGRRAEEIVNAGGWGGLEAPRLLPNYHYYLASLSGDLLESHLEPYIEIKFISKHYLRSPEKLGIDVEVMVILREMLKSQYVNDSWFALLQEHNFTMLREHVLKFFLWDDKRMLVNCAPSKQICKHRVVRTSVSANLVADDAFSQEMERDLTNQFIFAPKSDQVWLSLFALEVSSYRPAEVYFPPMPTTTRSVGCFCDEDALMYEEFDSGENRDKNLRPKSTLMTESQANLPVLDDCRQSPIKKKQMVIKKPKVMKRSDSRANSLFGGMSQVNMVSPKGSSSSVTSTSSRDSRKGTGNRHRRPYPSSFKQVLADPASFALFMKYLEMNLSDEAEAPLINFWHQVEIMKSYTNIKSRKEKALSIHRKYLYTGNNTCVMKSYLKANAETCPNLIEIAERKNITPNMMVNAQTYVCKLLEDRWWTGYKSAWRDEKVVRTLMSATSAETPNANINYGKDYRAHIRYLWGNFTFDLINFQRGLENKPVFLQFKLFLKKTAAKLREFKGRRSKEHGVAIAINGINVYVDRLQSDVDFFNEINRWISVKCAMSHGKRGKLKKESELILLKKADAIVSCFLRSCVPPKVSVNLPQRIIEDIEKRLDDPKKFNRCLFYNAVLHMITILLPFWKKFCFILSARNSAKDPTLIQTVSGHALSQASLTGLKDGTESDKEYEDLDKHIERVKKGGGQGEIKGLRKRLGTAFKRRDAALMQHTSSIENTLQGTGRIVCQFSLQEGACCFKHESGLEVPHPCETLLNPWDDKVEYLMSPLPPSTSRQEPPSAICKRGKEATSHSRAVRT